MKKENKCSNFLDYKVIGQEVRNRRLAKGYTQKDLAGKIGVTYQIILQYEKGTRKISIEKLYSIAEVLSVGIIDLIPVSNEKICLKNEELNLVREYKKINDQELRRMFCLLTKFVQVSEKSSKKAEKVKIAKKAGVSVDIVAKTIGLSADECVEEKVGSIYCQIGKKIKEWKRVYSKGFG